MEENDKNAAAAKMFGTSATNHQKEDDDDILPQSPLDSSFFNQLHINKEPSQTETAATSSTFPLPLPLNSSPHITPKKRKERPSLTTSSETPTKRRRGRPPGSKSKKKKEGHSPTTSETNSAETLTERIRGRPSASHIIDLSAGKDVVDVLYNISVANPRKTVTILSASGSVSDIVDLTPNGSMPCKGEFELYFMAIKCLVDDDGRHCREKAMFTVGCKDDKGNLFVKTCVNSLIVAGRVEIKAVLFNNTDNAKKAGARISAFAAAAAQNDEKNHIAATPHQMIGANLDPGREYSRKVMKEEGCTSRFLPTTPSVADGNIVNPTSATTSASNDQDMKSPSVGDI